MSKRLLTPSNLKTIKFSLSGLDEYLKKVQEAGNDINAAAQRAVVASAKPILRAIEIGVEQHDKGSGDSLKSVAMSDPVWEGNKVSVEVGIDSNIVYRAWHWVFVEWGSPTNDPADPVVRDAFFDNKKLVTKIQKQIFAEEAIPLG
jgi:HK97 gp10 family phage protein